MTPGPRRLRGFDSRYPLSLDRSLCEHPGVAAERVEVRPAEDADRRPLALLFAAVAPRLGFVG